MYYKEGVAKRRNFAAPSLGLCDKIYLNKGSLFALYSPDFFGGFYMKKSSIIFLSLIFIFNIAFSVSAEDSFRQATASSFTVSPIFSDNMVLQQNEPIKIWGTSSCEGDIINARMGNSMGWSVVENGKWEITLSERSYSSEPAVLEVYGAGEKSYKSFENIRFGDVLWVLGQSNVEYTVSAAPEADEFASSLTGNENLYICQIDKTSFSENNVSWRRADVYSTYTASALASFLGKNLDSALNSEVPIGIVSMGYSGCALSEFMPRELKGFISLDGQIYKNVIKNVEQMPIKALVWYQGESDSRYYFTYAKKLSKFIDWLREKKDCDFPVYSVELPPCFYDENDPDRSYEDLGRVRGESNSLSYLEKNFYVCPTSDLWSDRDFSNNIHPNNKSLIANRLALMILSQEYSFGSQSDYFAATVSEVERLSDNEVVIKFKNFGDGLKSDDMKGFVVTGKYGRVIESSKTEITSEDSVTVSADEKIYSVRYATDTDNVFGTDMSLSGSNNIPSPAFSVTLEKTLPAFVIIISLLFLTAVVAASFLILKKIKIKSH
jgi:sialate O-acetylesterase